MFDFKPQKKKQQHVNQYNRNRIQTSLCGEERIKKIYN